MRKVLSLGLVMSILLFGMPLSVSASDAQDKITSLKFKELQDNILARNVLVKTSYYQVDSTWFALDAQQEALKAQTTGQINSQKALLNKQIDAYKNEIEHPSATTDVPTLTFLKRILDDQLTQLNAIPTGSNSSFEDTRTKTIQKLSLIADMTGKGQVYAAQSLYLAYNDLLLNQEDLRSQLRLTQKNLDIQRLRQTLGLLTSTDVKSIELQVADLGRKLMGLAENLSSIRGDLNLMLGQDYDTTLTLQTVPEVDISKIAKMAYDEDLQTTMDHSLSVLIQANALSLKGTQLNYSSGIAYNQVDVEYDSEALKLVSEKRKLVKAFDKAYQDVKDKQNDLQVVQNTLTNESKKYDLLSLKYKLDIISLLEYESGTADYQNKVNSVTIAKHNLFKAYLTYDWMLQGLNVSSSSAG